MKVVKVVGVTILVIGILIMLSPWIFNLVEVFEEPLEKYFEFVNSLFD